jgi:hypothetical protein
MSVERWIRLIAGTFVTVSVALSYLHSSYWLLFTLFVGSQPLAVRADTVVPDVKELLKKLGVKSAAPV